MGARPPTTTRAKTRTSTDAAPPRSSARAQALLVAPEVSTSSTSTSLRPATAALPSAGTRNAPCTFWARPDLSSPTCCGVALTRLSVGSDSKFLQCRGGKWRVRVQEHGDNLDAGDHLQ